MAKQWTVMVYMVASNEDDLKHVGSLFHAALDDIMEMANAELSDNVNVVVQLYAPIQFPDTRWKVRNLTSELLRCPPNIEPFQPESLRGFVRMCVEDFPAEKYLLVFWGHGQGITWKLPSGGLMGGLTGAGDMTIAMLRDALSGLNIAKEKLIVGFNTCVMGMVEVYCEIQGTVGWVIGGADEIPITGWPYEQILSRIAGDPNRLPAEVAGSIVGDVVGFYNRKSQTSRVSYAACDLTGDLNGLLSAVRELTVVLRGSLKDASVLEKVSAARRYAEDYREDAYIDLRAFCYRLGETLPQTSKEQIAAAAVVEQLERFVIGYSHSNAYSERYIRNSGAVAVCFPRPRSWASSVLKGASVHKTSYENLAFNRATEWLDFVTKFQEAAAGAGLLGS